MKTPNVNLRGLPRFVVCLALFFLGGLSNMSAQEAPEKHKVRFRTLGWQVAVDDLFYELKHQDAKVSVTESTRSIFFEAPKEKEMVFYRLVPGTDDKNKKTREVAATVDISNAGHIVLLLFMEDPASPNRYRVTAVPDDPKSFPFPSCRFVNLTAVALKASYGDEKVELAPKSMALIGPHLNPNGGPQVRYTSVSMNAPQGPQLLYSNNWAVHPNCRTLVFIFPQNQRIQVMRISDDNSLFNVPPNK